MAPTLHLSGDRLTATLAVPAGTHLGLDELRALLTAENVHTGLDSQALLAATKTTLVDRTLVVARGRAPQTGAAGRLELLIQEAGSVYAEGTVDLHELHHFREVAAGTPLARLTAPLPGMPGVDVQGTPLPAVAGKDATFGATLGPGCGLDPHDEQLARAEFAGVYQRFTRGGRPFLQVSPEVRVPGDIDMTIGNISSQHPVMVQGDVHANFSLKSRGAITVVGSIEDARVSARGDLEVKGGILQGVTRVKAHGDLRARHIEAREVKARNLHIDFAIHFARIRATGTVTAKEIVGGEVLAAAAVTCDTLGDADGRPTLIQVGVDPFEEALVAWAHLRGDHLPAELAAARERCRMLAHRVQTLLSAGDDHAGEDLALCTALHDLEDLRQLEARCTLILARHPSRLEAATVLVAHARITVRRLINPGVIMRIGEVAELRITKPRPGGIFWLADGHIVAG